MLRDRAAKEGFAGSARRLRGAGRASSRPWPRPCAWLGAPQRAPLHDAEPEDGAERRRGSPPPADPSSKRAARPPSGLRRAPPYGRAPAPQPSPSRRPLPSSLRRSDSAPAPTCPRAPRPPPTRHAQPPSRPAWPQRACSWPAGLSDPSSGAVLLLRPPPWMCTPRTGWGCPARGSLAARAVGRPPSGTRGRSRRGAAGPGVTGCWGPATPFAPGRGPTWLPCGWFFPKRLPEARFPRNSALCRGSLNGSFIDSPTTASP